MLFGGCCPPSFTVAALSSHAAPFLPELLMFFVFLYVIFPLLFLSSAPLVHILHYD